MVGVDSGSLYRQTHSPSRLAWSWVAIHLKHCLGYYYIIIIICTLVDPILEVGKTAKIGDCCTSQHLQCTAVVAFFDTHIVQLKHLNKYIVI